MFFKKSADKQLQDAIDGLNKFTAAFEKAIEAADAELAGVEANLAKTVEKETKRQKAIIEKYEAKLSKSTHTVQYETATADHRKNALAKVKANATKVANNFKKLMYED